MRVRVLWVGVVTGTLAVGAVSTAWATGLLGPGSATPTATASVGNLQVRLVGDGGAAEPGSADRCDAGLLRAIATGAPDGDLGPRPTEPAEMLFHDRLSGALTPEEHARYAVLRIVDPAAVPEQYRMTPTEVEVARGAGLTGPALVAMTELDCLDEAAQDELRPYLELLGG